MDKQEIYNKRKDLKPLNPLLGIIKELTIKEFTFSNSKTVIDFLDKNLTKSYIIVINFCCNYIIFMVLYKQYNKMKGGKIYGAYRPDLRQGV